MYAYVGNDPVNKKDPFGLQECRAYIYKTVVQTQYNKDGQGYVDVNISTNIDLSCSDFPGIPGDQSFDRTYNIPTYKQTFKDLYKTQNGKEVRCHSVDIIADELAQGARFDKWAVAGLGAFTLAIPNPYTAIGAEVFGLSGAAAGTTADGIRLMRGDLKFDEKLQDIMAAHLISSVKWSDIPNGKLGENMADVATSEMLGFGNGPADTCHGKGK